MITSFHHGFNLGGYYTTVPGTDTADPAYGDLYGKFENPEDGYDRWLMKLTEVIDKYQPDQIWFDWGLREIPLEYRRLFSGHEQAGIKFHAPIDSLIRNNRIYNCPKGFWMDWMSQGTRITRNLCHDIGPDADLYLEVNHGPCVVDNNLFLSAWSVDNASESTLFAHNLFAGRFSRRPVLNRTTPFHKPHSTAIAEFREIRGGDDRLYNNLFCGMSNLDGYDDNAGHPSTLKGNRFKAFGCTVHTAANGIEIRLPAPPFQPLEPVPVASLEPAAVCKLPFTHPDGSPLSLEAGYWNRKPDGSRPAAGPFSADERALIQIPPDREV